MSEDRRPLGAIKVGKRHRKEMGDLAGLAASIRARGLLHPVVIRPDNSLVVGQRRLEAVRLLGWEDVPVRVVTNLDDAVNATHAEKEENDCRKDFAPSEAHAMQQTLLTLLRPAAEERKREGNRQGGKRSGASRRAEVGPKLGPTSPEADNGRAPKAAEIAAAPTGYSAESLRKVANVVKAAEEKPEVFAPIVEEMDRTGNVDGAYRKAQEAQRREVLKGTGLTEEDIAIKELPNETVVALTLRVRPWLLGLESRWPMPGMVEGMSRGGLGDALDAVRSLKAHLSKWEGWIVDEIKRRADE